MSEFIIRLFLFSVATTEAIHAWGWRAGCGAAAALYVISPQIFEKKEMKV